MTPPAPRATLGPEFDDFLFAIVGDDRNGMQLSVVSVLARVDLDPWHEAATLAALPGELAALRLAPLLAALAESTLQQASAKTTAVRLIALLPRRANASTPPAVRKLGAASATHPRELLTPMLIAIYLILSLGIQVFVSCRDPVVRIDTAQVSASASSQR